MNSILQCLSNTKELRDYCLQNQYLRDLNNNSRMRTALMSGTCPSLAAAGASLQQFLQHTPAAHPPLLWDPHPELHAAPWAAQPVEDQALRAQSVALSCPLGAWQCHLCC